MPTMLIANSDKASKIMQVKKFIEKIPMIAMLPIQFS